MRYSFDEGMKRRLEASREKVVLSEERGVKESLSEAPRARR